MKRWSIKPAADQGLPLDETMKSLKREDGLLFCLSHHLWWMWARTYMVLFHRLKVGGREHLPKELPFILVGNHSSHLDVLALAASMPWRVAGKITPVAAGDTFFNKRPTSFLSAALINALPLFRRGVSGQALIQLRERLTECPCVLIIFPEGTRSRTGEMDSFKAGIGTLLAGTPVPVIPCYLEGTFKALPPGKRFARFTRVSVTLGAGLTFDRADNSKEGWRAISSELEAAVACLRKREQTAEPSAFKTYD